MPLLRRHREKALWYYFAMHGIGAVLGVAWLAGLAAGLLCEAAAGPSDPVVPQLPPPSRLIEGMPKRVFDGSIVMQQADRAQLRVCPSPQGPSCQFTDLAAAAAAASPGSEIVLAPGVYEQGAVLAADGLILRGEPGAQLKGRAVEGKAALVVTGTGVVVEGIECSHIEVGDGNGACIRIEGNDLTVRNVNFHDNQEGILSGPGGGKVLIENSRFERNGWGGQAHTVYIGLNVKEFVFRGNSVLSTWKEGHGVKSRARRTVIEDNVIANLEEMDSRAIDVPNGGDVLIRRNLLEKGAQSSNDQMIGVALEGSLHDVNRTVIEENLIIFEPPKSALAEAISDLVDVAPARGTVVLSRSPGEVVLRRNVIVKARELGNPTAEEGNTQFGSRKAAGLPPYPEVSRAMLDQALRAR